MKAEWFLSWELVEQLAVFMARPKLASSPLSALVIELRKKTLVKLY